ncbi:hypothetical protein Sp245p_26010 (plasmid) [Azospirillum baldaniorum]|uniref:HTH luxR-type domain-containing protein n=1 Tax=Azospirillum baldaniorum TaxID=1064539 RepID=A0A9P1JZW9_9PROT|nr:helix-turn-helix transcriptional regulator [Azospirillum baldaniorum]AWJ93282.1 hypothetical protein Sp245p_26010 [Azospirillum baldaniorum]TWA77976.1 regulatory LuxR family protein [Azospirillum brasilense]CCD02924.1 protein of unknown function [Azospirillum baldaniorum]
MQISANQQAGECHGMAPPVQPAEGSAALTGLVAQVARLVACGHPDKEIATTLKVPNQSVKNAVRAAKRVLGVQGRAQFATVLKIRSADAQAFPLSPRHESVLALFSDGKRNKEIGRALSISAETVRSHMSEIFRRTGSKNRVQAAVWWRSRATQAGAATSPQMEA